MLVIAGPGTGKTQLLSLRVANILQRTDTAPEHILCLTFTNKAANNMRERLGSLVGAVGNRVPIRTFHSFAAELMTQYPDYFWNGARLTHVPDAVQLEIITDILGELPLTNPLALKFAGAFTSTRDVLEGLKLAKEAGLTPDKLHSLIELNQRYIDLVEPALIDLCKERLSYKNLDALAAKVAALPAQDTDELTRPLISLSTVITESFETARAQDESTGKTANVSKWKARWITTVDGQKGMFAERKRNDWWLALAGVYQAYRDRLHQRGFYDYADMIVEVITQMEQQPELRANVQEQVLYVLIDEFQDTNAAQLRLAHLVADHYTSEGQPNIMAVGDDDQAIYKFNGAELSNMLGFRRSYPTAKLVVLTDNYRSSQAVLDFSERIISQAAERVTTQEANIQKMLTARNEPAGLGTIVHLSYPTMQHQYHGLATKISQTFTRQEGSVAVLARSHESLRQLAGILRARGTPIRYEQQQSIFDQDVVRQIILVARIADALSTGDEPTANQHIAELLRHPVWGVSAEDLWYLALSNRRHPAWIHSLLESQHEAQANLGHWLLWLGRESSRQPLPRMLEYIIGLSASEHLTSPIRKHFLAAGAVDTPYVAGLSGVHKLMDLAQAFCHQGQAKLADFVRLIKVSEDNGQTITDESLFVSAPHAVELLTVHKAKGLEFDTVFIVDAMDTIWKPSNNGRKPPANLPLKPNGDDLDDYIRLMFVAVTRAKRNVYIGSYYTNGDGQPALPCGIVRDILPATRITRDEAGEPAAILEATLAWPRLEGSREKLLLGNTLQNYSLSATALLNFLDVTRGGPQYFLERHLLRLPEAITPKAAFGSAMHTALEYAQQLTCNEQFSLAYVLSRYETALAEMYLSQVDYDRYLLHGQQIIRQLFEAYGLELVQTGRPEVELTDLYIGPARINGTLDRVDNTDDTVLITDYKTGTPLNNLFTQDKTKQLKAWRHRTQLQFYALLAQTSGQFKNATTFTTQMLYVEAESPKDLIRTYTPTPEELDRLRTLLAIIWQNITTLNLPDIRHYDPTYQGIQAFEQDLLDHKI